MLRAILKQARPQSVLSGVSLPSTLSSVTRSLHSFSSTSCRADTRESAHHVSARPFSIFKRRTEKKSDEAPATEKPKSGIAALFSRFSSPEEPQKKAQQQEEATESVESTKPSYRKKSATATPATEKKTAPSSSTKPLTTRPLTRRIFVRKPMTKAVRRRLSKYAIHQVPRIERIVHGRHRNIPITARKLNEICRLVRGLNVNEALIQLKLSPKPKAVYVFNCIRNTRTSAMNNFGMDSDRLIVAEAWVGHAVSPSFPDFRAKGKANMKVRGRAHLTIALRHVPMKDGEVRLGSRGRKHATIARTRQWLKTIKENEQAAMASQQEAMKEEK